MKNQKKRVFNFKNSVLPPVTRNQITSYKTEKDKILMQAMIDKLESMQVVRKASDLSIIPKYASPCMLVKKNSVRHLPPGEYDQLKVTEKLRYNRFVLCLNKLNQFVEKIPAKMSKIDDTIRIVGSFEYVITTDLTDSFWQHHLHKDKLPYFAFHSPFKGTYIFQRSSQGLTNQSEGLEEMMTVILQEKVAET